MKCATHVGKEVRTLSANYVNNWEKQPDYKSQDEVRGNHLSEFELDGNGKRNATLVGKRGNVILSLQGRGKSEQRKSRGGNRLNKAHTLQ